MLRLSWLFAVLVGTAIGCGQTSSSTCTPCVVDSDCNGNGVCAALGGASYCALPCPNGNECSSSTTCTAVSTVAGNVTNACVDMSSTTCGPNPCQGASCSSDAGSDGSVVPASIGPNGGAETSLYFAIVGDTRPATEDDTTHYPTSIITTIFADLAGTTPAVPFVVSTGDYQYANPYGTESATQLQLYLTARGSYSGIQFAAMGNHECTGGTSSNCGSGNTDGLTNNYNQFMSMMLGPIQKTSPYYSINVNATDNSWTAKFVFIAANAWSSAQSSWLDSTLGQQTTYTFVVRHESASANTAPGVTPSEAIMAKHPYTLSIVGHSHEYYHASSNPREVIIGNGGAPLSTNQNYGYGMVTQRSDGSLQVDMYDYQTKAADTSFRFAVKADGSATQ